MATWQTASVFISSTFRDMHAERDYLVRYVFPRLREQLLKHRIHLIDVDLRWGITSDEDIVEVCKKIIEDCKPQFVCILGGRYGWVPDGKIRSITGDEIIYAITGESPESPIRVGWIRRVGAFLRRLFRVPQVCSHHFYFRDQAATLSIPQQNEGDFFEPQDSQDAIKLDKLKRTVEQFGYRPYIYQPRWDSGVGKLVNLEAFGEQVFQDVFQGIIREFGTREYVESDEFAEQSHQHEAFIAERVARITLGQRQKIVDQLRSFIRSDGDSRVTILSGPSGSGKSTLLAKVIDDHANDESSLAKLHYQFVGVTVGSTDLRQMLRSLCAELCGKYENLPDDVNELIRLFSTELDAAARKRRVAIVIDAINQMDGTDRAHELYWLPRPLPKNVRLIVSSTDHSVLDVLRQRTDGVEEIKLESLSNEDSRAIVNNVLKRYCKRMSDAQLDALLSKPESGNPLYLLVVMEELRTLGRYEEITNRIHELPGDVPSLFKWILAVRLSNDPDLAIGTAIHAPELVGKFMSFLSASQHGLSSQEFVALIEPGDAHGNVAALERLLRPYLMRRGTLLDFYHQQLADAAHSEYLTWPASKNDAHRALAQHFLAQGVSHSRTRAELPHHLMHAAMWSEYAELLAQMPLPAADEQDSLAAGVIQAISQRLSHSDLQQTDEPATKAIRALRDAATTTCADLLSEVMERAFPLAGWVTKFCAGELEKCVDLCTPMKRVQGLLRINSFITSGTGVVGHRDFLDQAEVLTRDGEASHMRPFLLTQLAFRFSPPEAIARCEEARELAESGNDPMMLWESYFNLARANKLAWRLGRAVTYFRRSQNVFARQHEPIRVIWSLEKLATTYTRMGHFRLAAESLAEEAKILKHQPRSSVHGKHLEQVGWILANIGDVLPGMDLIEKAAVELKAMNRKEYLRAFCKLAHAGIESGNLDRVTPIGREIEEAIENDVAQVSWYLQVWAMQTMGRLLGRLGDQATADTWFDRANQLIAKHDVAAYHIATQHYQAEALMKDERFDEAIESAADASNQATQLGDGLQSTAIAQLAADISQRMGDHDGEQQWSERAEQLINQRETNATRETLNRITR